MQGRLVSKAFIISALLATGLLPFTPQTAFTQHQSPCFPQTNECIDPQFAGYWQQNGGLPVFGFPVTPAQAEATGGNGAAFVSQWFERDSLELHPENQPPYNVLLGRLGDQRLRQEERDPAREPKGNTSSPHYYPQTGHAIAEIFWGFWRRHGLEMGDPGISERESLALFGYPITDARNETASDGKQYLTQWFERARFEYHPENADPYKVLLGLLGNETRPVSHNTALDRLNQYRQKAGAPAVQQSPILATAAQRHVAYLATNGDGDNVHAETPGAPGFSGAQPLDRAVAAGYTAQSYGIAEVIVPLAGPAAAIDAWMDLPLHRIFLLSPAYREIGYASSSSGKGPESVMDLGYRNQGQPSQPAPYVIAYPYDKQTGVPTSWNYYESPSPLPGGAPLPTGYPFSLQGAYGALHINAAEMRDGKGQLVNIYPNPSICADPGHNCYLLTPVSPLQPNTTYIVHVRGAAGSTTFDRTWQFTTNPTPLPRP